MKSQGLLYTYEIRDVHICVVYVRMISFVQSLAIFKATSLD